MLQGLQKLCLHNVGLFNAEDEEYNAALKIFMMTNPENLKRLILRFPDISGPSKEHEKASASMFLEELS